MLLTKRSYFSNVLFSRSARQLSIKDCRVFAKIVSTLVLRRLVFIYHRNNNAEYITFNGKWICFFMMGPVLFVPTCVSNQLEIWS